MNKNHKNCEDGLPISYTENTREENEILRIAENFHRQFNYLYPNRIKPPLCLKNECDVTKLVCTSLCPLKVSIPTEMKKWDFCAKFCSEYFDYEVIKSPVTCPEILPSVEYLLKNRKANSLELSVVLCTFLLASNYDAYIVQGYARKSICEKLESTEFRPPIKFDTNSDYHKLYLTHSEQEKEFASNKYQLDFDQVKAFWMEGKSIFKVKIEPGKEDYKEFDDEVLLGKRIHFWVLICSYKNSCLDSFFIESTTGEKKSLNDMNYLGIEFVWNNKNFWCNNQTFQGSCENIKFQLQNCAMWDVFLPDYDITEENQKSIRMPGTWVRSIELTAQNLKNRYPKGGRHIYYLKAEENKYNPKERRDGLVYRMTYYKTREKNDAIESHAFFTNRVDFLEYRKTDFENQVTEDVFASGRPDSLKKHEYPLKGMFSFPQKMSFYSHLRKDYLTDRTWTDTVIVDNFKDRTDRLKQREVHYFNESDEMEYGIAGIVHTMRETKKSIEKIPMQKKTKGMSSENFIELENYANASENSFSNKHEDPVNDNCSQNKQNLYAESTTEIEKESEEEEINLHLDPSSFDAESYSLQFVDIDTWNFETFLNNIDPTERYATSESESESDDFEGSKISEAVLEHVKDSKERVIGKISTEEEIDEMKDEETYSRGTDDQRKKGQVQEHIDEREVKENSLVSQNAKTMDLEGNVTEEKDLSVGGETEKGLESEAEEEKVTEEGEFDKEMEIYDEINFDALSDEELEIDYQLFLSKLWGEYSNIDSKEIFYMAREFQYHKNLRSRDILKLKKKIIRKRRKNVRYLQRMEMGKPAVRIYKKKTDEGFERERSIYANDLINYLNLKEKVGVKNVSSIEEFHLIENLDETHRESVNTEIIKKESLKLLDTKLKTNKINKISNNQKYIRLMKNSYERDPALPADQAVENAWFDLETNCYRLDFHYPENQSSRKMLLFTKPESGSTEFNFEDFLCREIIPSQMTKHTKKCQLYSYLVALMKKEPLLLREHDRFQNEMKLILEKRSEEENQISFN